MEERIMGVDSANNRASNEEALQRTRENYNSRESEETKKHKQEIKRITEAHSQEVQRLEADHTKNLNELKEKSKELLTSHDMKYQKDIDDLRDMHQKQLARTMQDEDAKVKLAAESHSGETQKIKQISDRQRESLIKNYESELKDKDERYSQASSQGQDKMHETGETLKKRFNEKYEKDMRVVNEDRERKGQEDRNQYETLRKNKDGQINQIVRAKESERNRLIKNFEAQVMLDKADRGASDMVVKQQFDDGILKDQEKFRKALELRDQQFEDARNGTDERITNRIDNQVRSLQTENQKIRGDSKHDLYMAERQKKIETGHIIDDYEKKLAISESDRGAFVENVNKKTHKQFDELNKKNSDLLYTTNKFYQENIGLDHAKMQEATLNRESQFEAETDRNEMQNGVRLGKIKNSNEIEQQRLKSYFEGSSRVMQENFDQRLDAVRLKNKEDQERLFSSFSKQAHENDKQFQEKLAEVSMRYENEIVKMNDQHLRDMKEIKTDNERRIKAQYKFDQESIEKQKAQLDYRLAKVEESHKKDIEAINRRHEATLADLSRLKGTPNNKT